MRKMWIMLYFLFYFFASVATSNSSFVYTDAMAKSCKKYICKDGSQYKIMYSVHHRDLKQIRQDSEVAFEMHIAIQARSNGHILLSPVQDPGYHDRVYEIVVGGGDNKFSELRGHQKRDDLKSATTPNILSPTELRGFYVKIDQDGFIEFGREGETLPILSYKDMNPLDIKYFSFSSWSGVEAIFLFDCPIPNSSNASGIVVQESEEIERPMSASDQLKREILMHKFPWISPKPRMDVRLGVILTSLKYDAFKSILDVTMAAVVSWTDDSMGWFPDKFNGTTSLKFRQGHIWRPKFYVFNSRQQSLFDARSSELISMVNSGEATLHIQNKVSIICSNKDSGSASWPRDEYSCPIVIQPWDIHDKISIQTIDESDRKMQNFAGLDDVVLNEWETASTMFVVEHTLWNDLYETDNTTQQSDRLIINVTLKRRATPYNVVFYTPLLVLVMFVLFSFWTESLTMNRVWFYAGCSIVISMGLCYIDYMIPCHTIPSILILYIVVLAGILIAMLTQVILMSSILQNFSKSNRMQRIFTWNIFRCIFCLPPVKISVNGGYVFQEDEEPNPSRSEDIEEMESDKEVALCDKKELAEVIDKIYFNVYFLSFAIMLAAHF